MPVPLRTNQKAEAKYNVTTEFPSLGLHAAAATGNVGLAEYALDHGQPINSVLDGVLPLHAACAGGNIQVVKLLIDHGADVNAPRLPRRYSNEKNRDMSVPIVGTSGSTPLHFAAANGNTEVVSLLLLHGAHANRPDKHGVTPEMLSRQKGWLECAEVLKQWLVNKDRDLRERPGGEVDGPHQIADGLTNHEQYHGEGEPSTSLTGRRRIHVKQSIDTALNLLKSSSDHKSSFSPANGNLTTPPASPLKDEAEDECSRVAGHGSSDLGSRHPSLPQIMQPPSNSPSRGRKVSTQTVAGCLTPQRSGSTDIGFDNQDQDSLHSFGGSTRMRKLGSKYSLMNLFRKAQGSEQTLDGSPSITYFASPTSGSSLALSASPNPPSVLANVSSDTSNRHTGLHIHKEGDGSMRKASMQSLGLKELKVSASLRTTQRTIDPHNVTAQDQHRLQQPRDSFQSGSGRDATEEHSRPLPSSNSTPLARVGISCGREIRRDRSESVTSSKISSSPDRGGVVFDEDVSILSRDSLSESVDSRNYLLRVHNRTSSAGQVHVVAAGFQALRFDPSSNPNTTSRGHGDFTLPPVLRMSSSVGSLPEYRRGERLPLSQSRLSEDTMPESAPPAVLSFEHCHKRRGETLAEDDDEEEYGKPLIQDDSNAGHNNLALKSPHMTLLMRERGSSFTSSESSLSPILSSDAQGAPLVGHTEFPFSINAPPVDPDETEAVCANQELLQVPEQPAGSRDRGYSVSSTSTSDSRGNPSLSTSGTTSGSGRSDTINTPSFPSPGREAFLQVPTDSSPIRYPEGLAVEDIKSQASPTLKLLGLPDATPMHQRRHPIPPDIDVTAISTRAQAEALVQKAQKEILEMDTAELSSGPSFGGRSPLSARLAVYGESLALERKFRELEAEQTRPCGDGDGDGGGVPAVQLFVPKVAEQVIGIRRDGVERQHSLEHRNRPRLRTKMPTRPSTAEGVSPRLSRQHFSPDFSGVFCQASRSTSAATPPRLSIDDNVFFHGHNGLSPSAESTTTLIVRDSVPGLIVNCSHVHSPTSGGDPLSLPEDFDADTELGSPIYRASTTPLGLPRSSKTTAAKLTKMGFPSTEQARLQPPKRFGAIRSFVQTLKGKP